MEDRPTCFTLYTKIDKAKIFHAFGDLGTKT